MAVVPVAVVPVAVVVFAAMNSWKHCGWGDEQETATDNN